MRKWLWPLAFEFGRIDEGELSLWPDHYHFMVWRFPDLPACEEFGELPQGFWDKPG